MSPSIPTAPRTAPPTADDIAAAVLAVTGVHGLHGGVLGEVATYLPTRRVSGVRLREDGCEVHLVVEWDTPVLPVADAVRTRVETMTEGPVVVVVEDLAPPSPAPDVPVSVPL